MYGDAGNWHDTALILIVLGMVVLSLGGVRGVPRWLPLSTKLQPNARNVKPVWLWL